MRRALSALSIAAIAIAIAVAPLQVSAAERSDSEPTMLALIDSARDQLTAMRIDPNLAVIQTGTWNYAGPNCPGAGWNCTDATIAIQLGIANQFECTGSPGGDTCVIIQTVPPDLPTSPSSNNYARCFIHSSASPQSCAIDQTNNLGDNYAFVEMLLVQDAETITTQPATQDATQNATVNQRNGGSLNHSEVSQTIQQVVREVKQQEDNTFAQTQDATQTVAVCQGGLGGCPGAPTLTPGKNHSILHQLVSQDAFANVDGATDQTQNSDIMDDVDQASDPGRSHSEANISEHQVMHAKVPGTQLQSGPVSCCATQTGSADNDASVNESSHQQSDGGTQDSVLVGTCNTSGNCTLSQSITNDTEHITNQESGTSTNSVTACGSSVEGACTTTPVFED